MGGGGAGTCTGAGGCATGACGAGGLTMGGGGAGTCASAGGCAIGPGGPGGASTGLGGGATAGGAGGLNGGRAAGGCAAAGGAPGALKSAFYWHMREGAWSNGDIAAAQRAGGGSSGRRSACRRRPPTGPRCASSPAPWYPEAYFEWVAAAPTPASRRTTRAMHRRRPGVAGHGYGDARGRARPEMRCARSGLTWLPSCAVVPIS